MKEKVRQQIQLIANKYAKLGLASPGYEWLNAALVDDTQLSEIADVLNNIENGEKLLNISKEISAASGDQRLDEVFAEFDTAHRLTKSRFFGTFEKVAYQPAQKNRRWPDFIADSTPVEVKLLTPQDLDPAKFFQKIIDKVNDHALPQLRSYYDAQGCEHGLVFIWSFKPVPLGNIDYYKLKDWFEKKVPRQPFRVTILFIQYRIGLWDFSLPSA